MAFLYPCYPSWLEVPPELRSPGPGFYTAILKGFCIQGSGFRVCSWGCLGGAGMDVGEHLTERLRALGGHHRGLHHLPASLPRRRVSG